MGSLRTLNVHCPWTEILAAVDTPTAGHGLPARVRCPLCGGARLTIYEDNISGGAWHYCFDCQHSGDMIELAAAVWDVSPGVAVRRLHRLGVPIPTDRVDPAVINKYVAEHPQYRNRMVAFWMKAREYLPKTGSPVLTALRDRFRLSSTMSTSRWLEGPGNLVGAYPHLAIERVFAPNSVIDGRCVSDVRIFKGRKWSDVLVVPHHDLPGRVCGFLFVGRQGGRDDRAFRVPHIRNHGCNPPSYAEGGLACFWAVQNSHGMLAEHVVACGDPFLAMRLHVRHFATARTALPLVAYHDGATARTQGAWAALGHKTPVLWGWRVTPSLVYQAVKSGGKLSVTELEDTGQLRIDHFVRNAEPRTILNRVVKAAKPWKAYLADWSERVQDGAIEELLLGLETYGIDPATLADIGPRFEQLTRVKDRPREVTVGRKTVIEKDGKWWVVGRHKKDRLGAQPSLLLNAVLRIDGSSLRRTAGRDDGVPQLKGRLIHQGTEIPFEVSVNTLSTHTPTVLESVLIRGKPGATLYLAPGWREHLIDVAKLFSGVV